MLSAQRVFSGCMLGRAVLPSNAYWSGGEIDGFKENKGSLPCEVLSCADSSYLETKGKKGKRETGGRLCLWSPGGQKCSTWILTESNVFLAGHLHT